MINFYYLLCFQNNSDRYNNSNLSHKSDNGSFRAGREVLAGNGLVWLDEENYGQVVTTTLTNKIVFHFKKRKSKKAIFFFGTSNPTIPNPSLNTLPIFCSSKIPIHTFHPSNTRPNQPKSYIIILIRLNLIYYLRPTKNHIFVDNDNTNYKLHGTHVKSFQKQIH